MTQSLLNTTKGENDITSSREGKHFMITIETGYNLIPEKKPKHVENKRRATMYWIEMILGYFIGKLRLDAR